MPWILQRAARVLGPGVDPYLLRSYVIIQASLLGCLVFSGAVALLAQRFWKTFAVLGGNAVLHLVLDATQTKWGNGVNFLAPFSWDVRNWGLFWPESIPTYALTVLGLIYIFWHWKDSMKDVPGLIWPSGSRLGGIVVLVGIYFLGPLFLLQEPIESNAHFLEVLYEKDRIGRSVEFDRARYVEREGEMRIEYYGGADQVSIKRLKIEPPSTVSIRGVFVEDNKVRATEYYVHASGLRDYASYAGLMLIVLVWSAALWDAASKQTK
ncbi:hypothetical protein GGQ20_001477 [Salinibacter ruber]|uniref:hypothetical protein n=1 Tax=Salinibacter ruber TaxID=146919 RepID=UPI002167DF85|nr:hypothetical protein [Salinibacter ruber]MCS3700168.1 hypothetical protein [Salinibacter ruber]